MKNKMIKIGGIGIAAFAAFMAPAYSLFDYVIVKRDKRNRSGVNGGRKLELSHIKKNHPRNGYREQYEAGKEWCNKQEMKDCYIRSKDGLLLHAKYLPAKDPKRLLLLSHGYRGSGFGNFGNIAEFLHENNCGLLFIDQRCCGESEGRYITFGAMEQTDVLRWSYYLTELEQKKLPVYLFGKSLGASAVLMSAAHHLPDQVRGLILDSGFRSMKVQMKNMALNWFHLNWIGLILFRLDILCRAIAGFRMEDADTEKALAKNRRPVLFFHGLEDTFVEPRNTLYHYSKCRAPKELVMIPGARHLCGAYVDPELYKARLMDFFWKND